MQGGQGPSQGSVGVQVSASIHTVIAPVAASGIGPYIPDPPTTLLIDVGAHLAEITADTVGEAQATAQQIVGSAEEEAKTVLETAQRAADELQQQAQAAADEAAEQAVSTIEQAEEEARRAATSAAEEVEEIKAAARADAAELRAATQAEIDELLSSAQVEADAVLAAARTEAESVLAEAEQTVIEQNAVALAQAEAVSALEDARQRAAELLSDAQASAEQILATAREDAQLEASRIRESAEIDALSSVESVDERIADIQAIHQIELATLSEREARLKNRISDLEVQISKGIGAGANGKAGVSTRTPKAPEPSRNGGGRKARTSKSEPEAAPKRSPWLIPDDEETEPTADAPVLVAEDEPEPEAVVVEEQAIETEQEAPLFESTGELRPAESLIEPLRPAAFRAGPGDKKRKRRR